MVFGSPESGRTTKRPGAAREEIKSFLGGKKANKKGLIVMVIQVSCRYFVYTWRFPSHRGTPKASILAGFSINQPYWMPPFQQIPIRYRQLTRAATVCQFRLSSDALPRQEALARV